MNEPNQEVQTVTKYYHTLLVNTCIKRESHLKHPILQTYPEVCLGSIYIKRTHDLCAFLVCALILGTTLGRRWLCTTSGWAGTRIFSSHLLSLGS